MDDSPGPIAMLVREHRAIEEIVTDARTAITGAAAEPGDAASVATALERLRDLEAFMEVDVHAHIAKEEQVLFPAIRAVAEETAELIEDLVAQHEDVKARHDQLRRVLDALDDHHDEVTAEASAISKHLREAGDGPTPEVLAELRGAVDRLSWILEGHFLDEEDSLFEPAEEWFDADAFARMAKEMRAIDEAAMA